MPTTYVEPLPHLRGRLNYVVYGSGPEGTKNRRERRAVRPLAQWCSFASIEQMGTYARKVRERFGNRKYEGHEIRVSWSIDELNPESEEDVLRAMEFGHALVGELFPESPYSIVAHGDGVGGCLHLHIDIVNVTDTTTCRAIRGFGRTNWQVKSVTDVLCRERQMRVVRPAQHASEWAERAQELESKIDATMEQLGDGDKWTHSLRDNVVALRIGTIIDRVITRHAKEIHGVEDLERHLRGYGVGIKRKTLADGSEGWTYMAEVELEGKSRVRRCKASKILAGYAANRVMDTVAAERERQEQAERERIEQQRAEEQARQEAAERWRAERQRRREEQEVRAEQSRLERERQEAEARLADERMRRRKTDDPRTDKAHDGSDRGDVVSREALESAVRAATERQAESRRLFKEMMEQQEREREQELGRAVRVDYSRDRSAGRVRVDADVFGGVDSPWTFVVKDEHVRTYASALAHEMPRGTGTRLKEELESWAAGGVDEPIIGTPAMRVADELFTQMRLGVLGKWADEMPRDKWGGFAYGFRLGMEAGARREGGADALSALCGMYALVCEQVGGAKTRIRDRAREVLTSLGVMPTSQRDERGNDRTPAREPWVESGRERAYSTLGRADGVLSRMDLPEWTGAAQGGSVEASDIDERTKIDERKEPTRLEDIDWGRSMNLGE